MGSKKFLLLLTVLYVCVPFNIFSGPVGSDSLVSIVSNTTFPTSDNDSFLTPNIVHGFGWMKNGFSFGDAQTTCTFNSVFPVAGSIDLQGGLLYLTSDLIFNNPSTLASTGIFYANNHTVDFASSITYLPRVNNTVFHNANVYFSNDTIISGTLKFRGTCVLDGKKNNVTLGNTGVLIVDSGSSLTLKNLELDGLKNKKLLCLDNSATLLFDNVRLVQSDNYSFTNGSITFLNDVVCSSSHTFKYDSRFTSTIKADSCWEFTDLGTLEIGRKTGYYGREPLYFEDGSSIIKMNNSTLAVTSSGARLTRGKFVGDGAVKLDVYSTNTMSALAMGDGVSIPNDLTFKLYPEAVFHLKRGRMIYDIIDGDNFLTDDVDVRFIRRGLGSIMHVNQDMVLANVTIKVDPYSDTELLPGKHIYYNNTGVSTAYGDYTITATYLNGIQELFGGNGYLFVEKGFYPFYALVKGTNNTFAGPGDIYSPITLADGGSQLCLDLMGRVLSNIVLHGGTIILGNDITFGNNAVITGSGKVQAYGYSVDLPATNVVLTSTLNLNGNGAVFRLNSDTIMASPLTFNGHWVINGNGNMLDFSSSGALIVGKNSFVELRNVTLRRVHDNVIRCFDNSGIFHFDSINILLSNDYSFTVGSLKIENDCTLDGPFTFNYQSGLTSTIDQSSQFLLKPDTTLAIGRQQPFGRQPLYFEDLTSQLIVDNATWSITSSGMRVTRGTVVMNREAFLDIHSTATWNGLIFGNGIPEGDMILSWNAATVARIPKGHVTINVTNPLSFQSRTRNTEIEVGPEFYLNLEQDMIVKNLTINSDGTWLFVLAPGKTLSYEDYGVTSPGLDYVMTGYQYDDITTLLAGNDSVIVADGAFPMVLLVTSTGNKLYGFGGMSGPIILTDQTAELTVGLGKAVSYDIALNGGKLILGSNLLLQNSAFFTDFGIVDAEHYTIDLPTEDITITSSIFFTSSHAFLTLNSDVKLASGLTFDGDWTILGNGKSLDLVASGSILVNKNSSLRFKDVQLRDVGGNDVCCFDNSGQIIFDNSSLSMNADYSFTVGSFVCDKFFDISGSATFFYQSALTSTINAYSTLHVSSGAAMSIGRKNSYGREPLYLQDFSSEWAFENASLVVTASGMHLTRGSFTIGGDLYFDIKSSSSQFGFIIGDGVAAHDPVCELLAGSVLHIPRGALVYEGTNTNVFLSRSDNPRLEIGSKMSFYVNQNMLLKNVGILPATGARTVIAAGKSMTYNQYSVFQPGIEYQITGQRSTSGANQLAGNGQIIIKSGATPLPTIVTGSGNVIQGMGNIGMPINMQGSTAQLNLNIFGRVFNNITMSGGNLTLGNLLTFGAGNVINGTGTVTMGNKAIMLVGADYSWTSTLTLDASGGLFMSLGSSNVKLSGTWTFSGAATLNGQGTIIDLGTTGQILVERGSTLTMKNITIKGLSGSRVRCLDNAGRFILQNIECIQTGDVSFSKGSIDFYDECILTGPNTTFAYCSPQTSYVKPRSSLYLDEKVTFSYDPITNNNALLRLVDSTSAMILNSATLFSTPTGLKLTKGILQVNGNCSVVSRARTSAEGIGVGDGISAGNDVTIDILPSAVLDLQSGYLVYNNLS
ncbi:hypothetical protein IPF37_01045 [bacterium]|nr:MAG: hypothetical protein IPF37_01045 [bacterium]